MIHTYINRIREEKTTHNSTHTDSRSSFCRSSLRPTSPKAEPVLSIIKEQH